jgi:DNA polymerase-4
VITTSTYEARALGVFSGDGRHEGRKTGAGCNPAAGRLRRLSPLLAPVQGRRGRIAPRIEDRGIDEIYIDLSDLPDDSPTLARRIKQAVKDATGLTCSIAISPNKLLSKIGSDLDKPDG